MSVFEINGSKLTGCDALIPERIIRIPETVTEIAPDALSGCRFTEEVILPAGLRRIGARAFMNMSSLRRIIIPEEVVLHAEDRDLFSGCASLEEIILSVSIGLIPDGFARGCVSLKRIGLPEGIVTVGKSAFESCTALRDIHIPESSEQIDENAFRYCSSLEKLYIGGGVSKLGRNSLDSISSDAEIIMPLLRTDHLKKSGAIRSFEDIACLFSPASSFSDADDYEKLALTCGYIMHPEFRDVFSSGQAAEYADYVNDKLADSAPLLCSRGIIIEILRSCIEQDLIHDSDSIAKLVIHARSRITSEADKKTLDRIYETFCSEHITYARSDRDKRLLRHLRRYGDPGSWAERIPSEIRESQRIVRYSDSEEPAPSEAAFFVLSRYMEMFRNSTGKASIHHAQDADEIAGYMNPADLTALCTSGFGKAEWFAEHPDLIFPYVRYASDDDLKELSRFAELWKDHGKYGSKGYETVKAYELAVLLSDSAEAMRLSAGSGMLQAYAAARYMSVRDLLKIGSSSVTDGQKASIVSDIARKYYLRILADEFLSGKSRSYEEWKDTFGNDPVIISMRSRLIFSYTDRNASGCFTVSGSDDAICGPDGKTVSLSRESRIALAHPCEMTLRDRTVYAGNDMLIPVCGEYNQMSIHIPLSMSLDVRKRSERYAGLITDINELHRTADAGIHTGIRQGSVQLSLKGKHVMTLTPYGRGGYVTGPISEKGLNNRELCHLMNVLDMVFFSELIRKGRLLASEYPELITMENVGTLLEYSLRCGHNENTAYLLGRKAELVHGRDSDPDANLIW